MSDENSMNMICPKCGQFQSKSDTCSACGVVVAKLQNPPVAGTPTEDPVPAASQPADADIIDEPQALPGVVRVVIAILAIAIVVGILYTITPREMTVAELVEGKKASFHVRDFKVQARVALDSSDSVVTIQSGDGRNMSSLKIEDGTTVAYVNYDPREISATPRKGDLVRVVGRFDSIPYVDGSRKRSTFYVALASSIKVLEFAAGNADATRNDD